MFIKRTKTRGVFTYYYNTEAYQNYGFDKINIHAKSPKH